MNRTVKKIGLILAIVILLPAMFFIVYEINSLNRNEEVLRSIYTSQLDAILFTVNQYSEDVVRSYASRVNLLPAEETKIDAKEAAGIFPEAEGLLYIAAAGKSGDVVWEIVFDSLNKNYRNDVSRVISDNKEKVERLFWYTKMEYQKLEPVFYNNNIHMLFVKDNILLFDFVLNPEKFINAVLAPKMQEVAKDQFVLKIFSGTKTVYSTADDNRKIQASRNIWLIPDYSLGILLANTTIDELVQERFYTNIIILSALAVILIAGVWIVFRNIKREIELVQIKSDFVSNVSHELRTPLALISMFAETLDMDRVKSEEKKKEYLKIINAETSRLSGIVNKILNFSKMEAGKRTYNFSEADINEITGKVFETYKFHMKNKGFAYSFTEREKLPKVNVDAEAVSEAVINLLDNAMKYSEDVKEVDISTGEDNGYVYVEVSDKGIGISEENQKKVFDKFFRVTSGLVHNTKGTGLGLTLVKHIIDAHKGRIDLKSRMWEGSTFRLLFPVNSKFKNR